MESIRTGEASALVNVIKADFFSTEQKIRRVNSLYYDEGNSPVEFIRHPWSERAVRRT